MNNDFASYLEETFGIQERENHVSGATHMPEEGSYRMMAIVQIPLHDFMQDGFILSQGQEVIRAYGNTSLPLDARSIAKMMEVVKDMGVELNQKRVSGGVALSL